VDDAVAETIRCVWPARGPARAVRVRCTRIRAASERDDDELITPNLYNLALTLTNKTYYIYRE